MVNYITSMTFVAEQSFDISTEGYQTRDHDDILHNVSPAAILKCYHYNIYTLYTYM